MVVKSARTTKSYSRRGAIFSLGIKLYESRDIEYVEVLELDTASYKGDK